MKILHICRNLAGSTVFPQLFEHLREQGMDQTVFVPEVSESNRGKNNPDGVDVCYAVTLRRSDTLFFWEKARRTVPEILRQIDLSEISLIHAHTLFTDGSIALALSRKTGLPFSVTLRFSDIAVIWKYEWHLHSLAREILKSAQSVVVLSPVVRGQVLEWFSAEKRKMLEEKIRVIPNGIEEAWLEETGRKRSLSETVQVGFAGVMNRRKRPLDMLRAVHLADRLDSGRHYAALACGDGPLRPKFVSRLRKDEEWKGKIQGMDAMKGFYRQCDILLVPSSAETFGMVYLEAMSQGIPVLYTRGQGFDGQFPDGEIGFSVVCGNPADQARALIRTADHYEEIAGRCRTGAAGYSWKNVTKIWKQLFEDILKDGGEACIS